MTKSNDAPPQQGHGLDGFYETLRRPGIARGSDGRWFAGVSTGLARWLGVDPLIVRAGFILFSIFFGMGVALYLVLWLLMPDERGEIHLERALKHGEGSSICLLIVTVISVLGGGPWWGGDLQGLRFGGFVLVAIGAWFFLTRTDTGRQLIGWPWTNSGQRGTGTQTGSTTTAAGTSSTAGAAGSGSSAGSSVGMPSGPSARPSTPVGTPSTGNAAANAGASLAAPRPTAPSVAWAPRQRSRSIGFAAGMLVLGAAVLVGALFTHFARAGAWTDTPLGVGIAAGLGVLGFGILVAGMAGRRAGGLAPLAWLGIIAAIFATAAPSNLSQPWRVGDQSYTPTSATPAPDYQLSAGQMNVDLTKLTSAELAKTPGADTVKATVGLGELDIVVPKGVSVTVHASGRAGEVVAAGSNNPANGGVMRDRMMTDTPMFSQDGTNWDETITYGPTTGSGPDLIVDAQVGLGQINITSGSTS
jgi:phage shock protein PspC (stress-responsive transcriptional regulator)